MYFEIDIGSCARSCSSSDVFLNARLGDTLPPAACDYRKQYSEYKKGSAQRGSKDCPNRKVKNSSRMTPKYRLCFKEVFLNTGAVISVVRSAATQGCFIQDGNVEFY